MKGRNNFITLTKVCRFGQAMSDKTITVNIDNILYFESSVDEIVWIILISIPPIVVAFLMYELCEYLNNKKDNKDG